MSVDVTILLGPAGSGKGTQARMLVDDFGFAHISTGEMIRKARGSRTPLGIFMEEIGWADPETLDTLVLDALGAELAAMGDARILLDNTPQALDQAHRLDDMFRRTGYTISRVIEFTGDEETMIARMLGRYTCMQCKAIYHETERPTLVVNTCDICGAHVFERRPEDTIQMARNRMNNYKTRVYPVVQHYAGQGLVSTIDGTRSVAEVSAQLRAILTL